MGLLLDIVFLVGMASLGYGLWLVSPSHMFIVMGIVLIFLSLSSIRVRLGGKNKPDKE